MEQNKGMTDQLQVLRGNEAAQVIENDAFKSAMQMLKDQVTEQWKACPVRDREGQLLLLQLAKLTDKFESLLIGMIENGKFAQHKIDIDQARDESKAKRAMRRILG